jgi:rRNA maturation endonuclease Nob1
LFGGSAASDEDISSSPLTTLTCDSCGDDVDEEDMQEGQCEDCYSSDYTGAKYCCGMIYEEGEDTCNSCGESL